jgi:hypothetical protein
MSGDQDEYYRKQAEDAERQAARAVSPRDRATWLRLAQDWLGLVKRKPPQNAGETFDDAVQQRGTHQDISDRTQ